MPKVRRSRKPPPEGWELIEPTLDELDQKMREGKASFSLSDSLHMSMLYVAFDPRLSPPCSSSAINHCFNSLLILQLRQNHMKGNERQSLCGQYLGIFFPSL